MRNAILLYISLFLTPCSFIWAQHGKNNITSDEGIFLINQNTIRNDKSNLQDQKQIYITQIGDENIIASTLINSSSSDIKYTQIGNQNSIDVLTTSQESKQTIDQIGDQNKYSHYNYNSTKVENINIIQKGNNQNIDVFGQNTMSQDLKITIIGSDKSLIIRNY
ncbi:hypothetical protein HX049_13170 [Myroides odoratimimus]|uniref:hypothetical protein n=1 Tax=Myroides odoratimimus TaxID=76832 RepID=UPI002574B884|nr:hypothetical protein [Myroides odoratimimus]MDM1398120.1 hypothetical protein [Myroides odoratimimus]